MMNSDINIEEMKNLYWNEGLSLKQLAEKYNVSKSTIHNKFKTNNIPTRKSNHDIDYTGDVYGKLTVIKKLEHGWYLCRCSCGNIETRHISKVRSELKANPNMISCCEDCRKKIVSEINQKNITNKKFGLLTALYPTEEKNSSGCYYWHCICDCGNEKDVPLNYLTAGVTRSCGCLASKGEQKISQILKENNIKFEQQKTFDECRFPESNQKARFDFYLPDYNCLIEFDGIYHYEVTNKIWDSKVTLEQIKEKDNYKTNFTIKYNYHLIRIPYYEYDNINLSMLLPQSSKFLTKELQS